MTKVEKFDRWNLVKGLVHTVFLYDEKIASNPLYTEEIRRARNDANNDIIQAIFDRLIDGDSND